MATPPKTLPADFFSGGAAPKPPETLPADFFSSAPRPSYPTDAGNQALSGTGIAVSPPPSAQLPAGMSEPKAPTNAPAAFGMSTRNPRSGRQYSEKDVAARVPIIDAPTEGVQEIGRGAATMSDPSMERKAHGLHQVLGGVAQVATPIVAPAMVATAVPSAIGLGVGMATQKGVQAATSAMGVPEGYSELAGDAAGLWQSRTEGSKYGSCHRSSPRCREP